MLSQLNCCWQDICGSKKYKNCFFNTVVDIIYVFVACDTWRYGCSFDVRESEIRLNLFVIQLCLLTDV